MTRSAALLIVWLAWFGAAGLARGADLTDPVPGHPGLTWFDLMKLVVTDLTPAGRAGATGSHLLDARHIEGKDAGVDPPDTITIGSVDVLPMQGDPDRVILMADLGQVEDQVADPNILALFSLSPRPRLLDVVEVGTDRDVGLASDAPPLLAPGAPLVVISSGHDNSNQSYRSAAMIFVHGDKFQLIDTVFTFGQADCQATSTQTPDFAVLPAPGPYKAVRVQVREEVVRPGDRCGDDGRKKPVRRTTLHQALWRWDPRRGAFATTSHELDGLAEEDAKKF